MFTSIDFCDLYRFSRQQARHAGPTGHRPLSEGPYACTNRLCPTPNPLPRWSSKEILILLLKYVILLHFVVYGISEDLAAWKILLPGVVLICLQFWELPKMTQHRRMSTFFPATEF